MSRTSLKEVAHSELKVVTLICRQQVATYAGGAEPAVGSNTSAYRGTYKLQLPQGWDCNRPTYLAVESVDIYGIPMGYDPLTSSGQLPFEFQLRSDALAGEGVFEAKRWRGDINVGDGDDTAAAPYATTDGGHEIEISPSNILQTITNTQVLNQIRDNTNVNASANCNLNGRPSELPSVVDLDNFISNYFYKVNWKRAVDFTSLGHKLTLNSAQSMIDVYITANGDVGNTYTDGTVYENKLKLMNAPCPDAKIGPSYATGGVSGGGWTVVLKIFQPSFPIN